MKIDPGQRTPLVPQQAIDDVKRKQEPGGFGAVLQQTIQKTGPLKESKGATIRSMTGPQAPLTVLSGSENAAETLAHKLLDTLEDYQMLLGDPDVPLKRIQPALEQMQHQAADTREFLYGLPESHPLRSILQDTVDSIDQETVRFNAGYYVDG